MANLPTSPQFSGQVFKEGSWRPWCDHPRPWLWSYDKAGRPTGAWVEIETVNYAKTSYTEGFGALGFSLDDERSLLEVLERESS